MATLIALAATADSCRHVDFWIPMIGLAAYRGGMLFKDIQESGLRMILAESVRADECINKSQIGFSGGCSEEVHES
jgi:hypothetical protein